MRPILNGSLAFGGVSIVNWKGPAHATIGNVIHLFPVLKVAVSQVTRQMIFGIYHRSVSLMHGLKIQWARAPEGKHEFPMMGIIDWDMPIHVISVRTHLPRYGAQIG